MRMREMWDERRGTPACRNVFESMPVQLGILLGCAPCSMRCVAERTATRKVSTQDDASARWWVLGGV